MVVVVMSVGGHQRAKATSATAIPAKAVAAAGIWRADRAPLVEPGMSPALAAPAATAPPVEPAADAVPVFETTVLLAEKEKKKRQEQSVSKLIIVSRGEVGRQDSLPGCARRARATGARARARAR